MAIMSIPMEDRIPTIFVLEINITLHKELVPEVAAVADAPVPAPVLALAVDVPVAVKKIPTETIDKKTQSNNTCISRTNPRAEKQLWDKLLYDQPGEAIVKAFRICVNCKGCAEMHFNRYTSRVRFARIIGYWFHRAYYTYYFGSNQDKKRNRNNLTPR